MACDAWTTKVLAPPKSGKHREVPLTDDARAALKAHRRLRGKYLGGDPLTKGECKRPLYRACNKAGLRRIGWHVLPYAFASHLAMCGVPIKAIVDETVNSRRIQSAIHAVVGSALHWAADNRDELLRLQI